MVITAQASLDSWAAYDSHATAVYTAIQSAAADISAISQAHADAWRKTNGGRRAVSTVDSLVVFTDLDETARFTKLEEILGALRLLQPTVGQMSLVAFDKPDWFALHEPVLVASIDAPFRNFSAVLGSDFVFHADGVDELITAFDNVADKINREANAWYELFICPPICTGTGNALSIELPATCTGNAPNAAQRCDLDPLSTY